MKNLYRLGSSLRTGLAAFFLVAAAPSLPALAAGSECAGNYRANLNGWPCTIQVQDAGADNIAGSITCNAGDVLVTPIAGTCAAGTIRFTRFSFGHVNPQDYTGGYTSTGMSGTFTHEGVGAYPWTATRQ